MSIFDSIKDAIWGHGGAATAPGAVPPGASPLPGQPGSPAVTLPGTVPPTAPVPPTTLPAVDVHAVLTALAAKQPQLDWQHSIVDLMKLLAIDSSFQHRVDLAKELGYAGSQADSAAMNMWLYSQVMRKLAASGGKVPAELLK